MGIRGLAGFCVFVCGFIFNPIANAYLDYRVEYKAYNEALAAGDLELAIKYSEAAWRAAQKELGNH